MLLNLHSSPGTWILLSYFTDRKLRLKESLNTMPKVTQLVNVTLVCLSLKPFASSRPEATLRGVIAVTVPFPLPGSRRGERTTSWSSAVSSWWELACRGVLEPAHTDTQADGSQLSSTPRSGVLPRWLEIGHREKSANALSQGFVSLESQLLVL